MVRPSYFSRGYVSQARWTELWQECGRLDYVPVVDVRIVKGDMKKAVQETLKYSVKPADMEADGVWLLELTRQVHKLRFIATGGALKGVLKPVEAITNGDMVLAGSDSPEAPESPQMAFAWERPEKRYKRKRKPEED
jgi:hypothetical protein